MDNFTELTHIPGHPQDWYINSAVTLFQCDTCSAVVELNGMAHHSEWHAMTRTYLP